VPNLVLSEPTPHSDWEICCRYSAVAGLAKLCRQNSMRESQAIGSSIHLRFACHLPAASSRMRSLNFALGRHFDLSLLRSSPGAQWSRYELVPTRSNSSPSSMHPCPPPTRRKLRPAYSRLLSDEGRDCSLGSRKWRKCARNGGDRHALSQAAASMSTVHWTGIPRPCTDDFSASFQKSVCTSKGTGSEKDRRMKGER